MALDLTVAQFEKTCGYNDAKQLSRGDDTVITECITRSKIKVKSLFLRASVSFDETEDITSTAILYYAIFLLYQRADIATKASWWRKEAYEAMESILGETVSEDPTDREKKALLYVKVVDSDDGVTHVFDGF